MNRHVPTWPQAIVLYLLGVVWGAVLVVLAGFVAGVLA